MVLKSIAKFLRQKRLSQSAMAGMAICFLLTLSCLGFFLRGPNLQLKTGQCWKGSNATTLSRLTNLQATYEYEEFLEGPGLTAEDDRVACKLLVDEAQHHRDHTQRLHHTMQQLYRCFSWFNANRTKDPYLIMKKQPLNSDFFTGFIERLRSEFGVRIVKFRSDLKVARGIVNYGFDDPHSFAMHDATDAAALRYSFLGHYRLPKVHPQCAIPRIGVLNRKTFPSLRNVGALVHAIEDATKGQVKFQISTFESRTFYEQLDFLSATDILISPHGEQLSGLPFLPTCGRVLEIFPAGFHAPHFFGSLAAVSDIDYSFLYLGRNARRESKKGMRDSESQEAVRKTSLCPEGHVVADAVLTLIDEWRQCCTAKGFY